MSIFAITAIVLNLTTWSFDIYAGTKIVAHCSVQAAQKTESILNAQVICKPA